MDIPQVLGHARHRRHAGRDGLLSIPCCCRWSRASARRSSSRRCIRRRHSRSRVPC